MEWLARTQCCWIKVWFGFTITLIDVRDYAFSLNNQIRIKRPLTYQVTSIDRSFAPSSLGWIHGNFLLLHKLWVNILKLHTGSESKTCPQISALIYWYKPIIQLALIPMPPIMDWIVSSQNLYIETTLPMWLYLEIGLLRR